MGAGRGLGTGPSLVARGRTLNTVTLLRHILSFTPPQIFFSVSTFYLFPAVRHLSATGLVYTVSPCLQYLYRRVIIPRFASAPRMHVFIPCLTQGLTVSYQHCTALLYALRRVPTGIAMSTAETFSPSSNTFGKGGTQGRG